MSILASTFTRTYYVYLGDRDTDTLAFYYPESTEIPLVDYNWVDASSTNLPEEAWFWTFILLPTKRDQLNCPSHLAIENSIFKE